MRKISRTTKTREFITKIFNDNNIENYYFKAHEKANFPYIVWENRTIASLDDNADLKQSILEINAYDDSSILILDELLDKIETILDKLSYTENGFMINIYYSDNRFDIDEGRKLKRKRTQYEMQIFYKEC